MLWIRMTLADDGWGSNISYELLAIILALVAMSALGQKQTCASQKAMSALPRIAIAKANSRKSHVRFTPESGHVRCKRECPLWANSGHCEHYSISSSARPISVFGTVMPNALAVLRLMTSSYLV